MKSGVVYETGKKPNAVLFFWQKELAKVTDFTQSNIVVVVAIKMPMVETLNVLDSILLPNRVKMDV